jgi:hypothetical protein
MIETLKITFTRDSIKNYKLNVVSFVENQWDLKNERKKDI